VTVEILEGGEVEASTGLSSPPGLAGPSRIGESRAVHLLVARDKK
jgi:hypothetical protein